MIEKDRIEFIDSLTKVSRLYGNTLEKDQVNFYFEILKEYDVEDIKLSLVSYCKIGKFFPRPSELIDLMGGGEDNIIDEAFARSIKVISNYWSYHSAKLIDKIAMLVIADLGGVKLLGQRYEKGKDIYFDFKKVYKCYLKDIKNNKVIPNIDKLGIDNYPSNTNNTAYIETNDKLLIGNKL